MELDQIQSELAFAAQLSVDINHQVQGTTPAWNKGWQNAALTNSDNNRKTRKA